MTLDEIQKWIDENAEIGIDLDRACRDVPKLHGRAINIKANEVAILKAMELQFDQALKDRWVYYSGKADPVVYKEEPFDLKILKNDLDIFINADKKVAALKSKIEMQQLKIDALDNFIKGILQRSFLINNIISYQKLMAGLS